jgi:hypothetical protein
MEKVWVKLIYRDRNWSWKKLADFKNKLEKNLSMVDQEGIEEQN